MKTRLGFIVVYRCCRDWPVVLPWVVRACGVCGEVPRPKGKGGDAA